MFTVGLGLLGATVDHHDLPEHRRRPSSSASASAARCWPCSCGSAAASSPRRPTSAPTSSARSRPASPRTTPATRPPSPTTWATTSATAPAWPPTCSRATRSPSSPRSSSASPRSSSICPDDPHLGARAHLPARLLAPSACWPRSSASSPCGPREDGQVGPDADQPGLPRRRHPHRASARCVLALVYVGNAEGTLSNAGLARMFGAVVVGLVLAQVVSRLTEYFTSTETRPVQEIAEAARTGPATTVLSGIASGLETSVWAVIAIAIAIGAAIALGGGNLQFSLYLVALAGMGMLATTGVIVSRGHVRPGGRQRRRHRRDVGRVPRRARAHHGQPRRRRQHHQGRHQGLRHRLGGHRRRRPVRHLHRDDRRRARRSTRSATRSSATRSTPINVADPKIFIGLLIGGSVAFLFSVARHPRRRPHRRRRRAGGPPPVRRRQDHERREAARLRPGHRHLHHGLAARAGHAGAARRAHAGHHRLRHQLLRARRVPRRGHPHRPADGQLPVATPVARGTTPRSTSRTATRAARAPRPTRRRSSATPSATRSRTPPARR